jgi:hypothetical protein
MAQIIQYLIDARRPGGTITVVLDGLARPAAEILAAIGRAVGIKTWRLIAWIAYPGESMISHTAIVGEVTTTRTGYHFGDPYEAVLTFGGDEFPIEAVEMDTLSAPVTVSTVLTWGRTRFRNGGRGLLTFNGQEFPITFTQIQA